MDGYFCGFIPEHASGAGEGVENGVVRARKSGERKRDLKKYGWVGAGASGIGRGAERAESAAHNPLKPNSITINSY